MPTPQFSATTTHAAVAAATNGPTSQAVVIGVPLLIIALIVYLCRHHRHKASTAVLGFVAGVLLAGSVIGSTAAHWAVELTVSAFRAIGSLFTG